MARIDNGKNLLQEIRRTGGYEDVPIIVMTAHGHESYRLSSDVLRLGGANDLVAKPFLDGDQILERAISDVLRSSARCRPGAKSRSESSPFANPPSPFEHGELTFYPSRVELCGVKVCGDETGVAMRRILDTLRSTDARGRRRSLSGEELAGLVGSEGGPPAVAGAIRNFRNRVKRTMLVEANVAIDPATDLIVNDRQHGYRLSEKITVAECAGVAAAKQTGADRNSVAGVVVAPPPLDHLASSEAGDDALERWILAELKKASSIRRSQIVQRTGWSDSTVRRALARLRNEGRVVFEGSARSGYWRLT